MLVLHWTSGCSVPVVLVMSPGLGCRSGGLAIMPRLMVILVCEVPIDSGASGLSNLISTWRILGLIHLLCYGRTQQSTGNVPVGKKKKILDMHQSARELRAHSRVASREMGQSFERPCLLHTTRHQSFHHDLNNTQTLRLINTFWMQIHL